ncbi:acyl-CoA thioesterase [Altererythrobacter sp. GH1-8]|uniref:acyl-CoA thioesterase n=1 Tax=Altererythrobacter sp. GH1-8 TaxID=3349333 RepID=UPI00374DE238
MSIQELLEPIKPGGGKVTLGAHETWLQGRAFYGGASALVAYTAAIRTFKDLPPLRAAQIAFVAPSGADVELRHEIVRQGRNVTQVRSEMWTDQGCALTAFFLFGAEREPNALHAAERVSPWPGAPLENESLSTERAPRFLKEHFEIRRAQEERGRGLPTVRRWAKLKDSTGLDPISELILLGDVLPPGAMRAMERHGPISSINWSFNVLDPRPSTEDGWWLSENTSQQADHGYSSERLRMWNTNGDQMLDGMQCVAIFG